ncbi:MAG: ABC transporter ATP-binding protein [Candidatus Delongbacteria bacterium]|nr:ABC transporter ATP-binding protein [Candidatus Delongbacteria bacterium]
MNIVLSDLCKQFDDKIILDRINLSISQGEFFFLLGPSGCGKTTLLRLIAGLETPTSGSIFFNDRDITRLPPNQRQISMVFQNYALWPHMTVYQNTAFGLELQKLSKKEQRDRIDEILSIVRLQGYESFYPNQLSGGQQQRVALARALVVKPQLLLLDEPLSNLDAALRNEMRIELRRIQKKTNVTAIYVTHDQKEALTMADRMAIMVEGRVDQVGEPHQIYYYPDNKFIAGFIGEANFIKAEVVSCDDNGYLELKSAIGPIRAKRPENSSFQSGDSVMLSIRPSMLTIFSPDDRLAPIQNLLDVKVRNSVFLGETQEYRFKVNDILMCAIHSSNRGMPHFKHGDPVRLHLPPDEIMIFHEKNI